MADKIEKSGSPPSTGWQPMVCELLVSDILASRSFWCDVLGFNIAYERPEQKFVYLEKLLDARPGMQIMLCERSGKWETGPLKAPLGQGVMFQIEFEPLDPMLEKLNEVDWPIYAPLREVWRQVGDREFGQREIFIQDPDGYLLMLNQTLGDR